MRDTLWKHEQTDGSGNWFLHFFAWLFSLPCSSHVAEWKPTELRCGLTRWHSQKHHDTIQDTRWCYGDEFCD